MGCVYYMWCVHCTPKIMSCTHSNLIPFSSISVVCARAYVVLYIVCHYSIIWFSFHCCIDIASLFSDIEIMYTCDTIAYIFEVFHQNVTIKPIKSCCHKNRNEPFGVGKYMYISVFVYLASHKMKTSASHQKGKK